MSGLGVGDGLFESFVGFSQILRVHAGGNFAVMYQRVAVVGVHHGRVTGYRAGVECLQRHELIVELRAAGAREELHRSLDRMGVDHVDLWQLHSLADPIECARRGRAEYLADAGGGARPGEERGCP